MDTTPESKLNAFLFRHVLSFLAAFICFIVVMWVLNKAMSPTAGLFRFTVFFVDLIFSVGLYKALMTVDKEERRRFFLGMIYIILMFGILWTMNNDLMTGDIGLKNLRAEQVTCTPSAHVGKGYTPLEPCLSQNISLKEPSFSSGTVLCGDTPQNPCAMTHLKYILLRP